MTLNLIIGVFIWLLGLCVGSFLNVVVYRLPRDLSIARPRRSFCPHCQGLIAWYDNVPVVSWLVLRARCRRCGGAVSAQYPLVEAATGLAFVLVYYLLYVADARAGVGQLELARDWPLLASWLVLVAALVACAAMDLAWYIVDVRVTYVAMAAGLVLHGVWPEVSKLAAPVAAGPLGAAALAVGLGSLVMLIWGHWRVLACEEDGPADADEDAAGPAAAPPQRTLAGGIIASLALVAVALWLLVLTAQAGQGSAGPFGGAVPAAFGLDAGKGIAVGAALLVLFATMVLAGGQRRTADDEVREAIEAEQGQARRLALWELLWLAGPILAGGLAAAAVWQVPAVGAAWRAGVAWGLPGGFCPLGGFAYAMLGLVGGATAGWLLRIVFTLIFGREALGVGDIYILAAAGATAGWDMALLGLLLAVGFAVAGYVLSLLLKQTVIIPFGPWLALGFIAALWLSRPAAGVAAEYCDALHYTWVRQPEVCGVAGGLLLVGSGVAIVLARLARRAVERMEK
jgi:prepilin signal peptidase PulO-like enzyme (type II secretory pathway)